jgi:SOS-response transcriptional repressor LexA
MTDRSTKRQKELLDYVADFIGEHGYGPSYREVMAGLGYKSVSTVATHIDGLITRGYLRKRDNSARSLEVVTTKLGSLPEQAKLTPVKEKWLVEAVTNRFEEYEKSKQPQTLDEIYVLIGALKILGLDDAHLALKTRLTSL